MNVLSSSTLKNIGIGVVSLIIIGGAYIFLVNRNNAGQALLSSNSSSGASALPSVSPVSGVSPVAEAQDVVLILNQLKSISIDETIFNDPAFTALTDFHRDIAPQPKGRSNPFAPGEGVKTGSPSAGSAGLR